MQQDRATHTIRNGHDFPDHRTRRFRREGRTDALKGRRYVDEPTDSAIQGIPILADLCRGAVAAIGDRYRRENDFQRVEQWNDWLRRNERTENESTYGSVFAESTISPADRGPNETTLESSVHPSSRRKGKSLRCSAKQEAEDDVPQVPGPRGLPPPPARQGDSRRHGRVGADHRRDPCRWRVTPTRRSRSSRWTCLRPRVQPTAWPSSPAQS